LRAERELVLVAPVAPVGRRVLAERDLGQHLLRRRPGGLGAQHLGRAEQQAARGGGALVLDDPTAQQPLAVAAAAQPVTEAGHGLVEDDGVLLAAELERGYAFRVEPHGKVLLGEAGGKREAASPGPLLALLQSIAMAENLGKQGRARFPAPAVRRARRLMK